MHTYTPPRQRQTRHKKTQKRSKIIVALIALLIVGSGVFFWLNHQSSDEPLSTTVGNSQDSGNPTANADQQPVVDLQPTIDAWLAKQSAIYGIEIYDPANQQVIATHNADRKFFAASLYKIFVAYLMLKDFQDGTQNPDEILSGSYTKKECVDKMIRESYSPCGEAAMADMGQETLRQRVAAMGIDNTIFAGITTTAHDSSLILQYILEKRDLNDANTAFLEDAMHIQDQKFRKGLAGGAPDATWYTKVGWNETYNYHDIGIMTLPNGRQYMVAILSQNNGSSAPIADFAATIYSALNQ